MITRFLLIVCFVLLTDILYAQNVENDTIYDCEDNRVSSPDLISYRGRWGERGWSRFVKKNAIYPRQARRNGITGHSVVAIVIYKDGSKSEPVIEQSSDSLLDAEALRVVSMMPDFKHGWIDTMPVNVRLRIPFYFMIYSNGNTKILTYVNRPNHGLDDYCAIYTGWTALDYSFNNPDLTFLDSDFGGDLEIFDGGIFRNDKKLAFSFGGGLRVWHCAFKKAFDLKTAPGRVFADSSSLEVNQFKRHTLRVVNLSVPLAMHYRFYTKKSELSFWLMGNVRVGCRERQVYDIGGVRKKVNIKDDFLVRRFSYDCALEFTNHCVSVRVTYAPSSFFKKGVSPFAHYIIFSMGFRLFEGQLME